MDIVTTLYGRQERSWQMQANCMGVDPDLFFPERGASTREAKEVCRGCVVREDCLEYALANGEKFGIWGGMSERERRRVRRARALQRRDVVSASLAPHRSQPGPGAGASRVRRASTVDAVGEPELGPAGRRDARRGSASGHQARPARRPSTAPPASSTSAATAS